MVTDGTRNCTKAACQSLCDDDDGYACSFCLCFGTGTFCETCQNTACPACVESADWSPEPHKCAECAERPADSEPREDEE